MAKRNTWCQKLMHKAKVQAMREKLGNEEGVLSRGGSDRQHNKAIFDEERAQRRKYGARFFPVDDGECPDKPMPKAPQVRALTPLPRKPGYTIKPFGRKGQSGCVMSPKVRADIKAHDARLNAQVATLIGEMV